MARLHLHVGGGMLFGFGSTQSFENSDEVVAEVAAGGLGLPDRDYYLKDDARSKEIRKAYLAHVEESLRLSGLSRKKAAGAGEDGDAHRDGARQGVAHPGREAGSRGRSGTAPPRPTW